MLKALTHNVTHWYGRFERPISSISLVGGFVFDALTLKRVDAFWENIWIMAHLLGIALCIVFMNARKAPREEGDPTDVVHFWLLTLLQFFFGGTLSTFLIFYFRSGSALVTWPFLLILVIAFFANERLRKYGERLIFQISFFFLSLYLFMIFLIPIILHSIGPEIFVLSSVAAVVVFGMYWHLFSLMRKKDQPFSRNDLFLSIGSILLVVNILYFTHLIPPIPLSLKAADVYQSVSKNESDQFVFVSEKPTVWNSLRFFPHIHVSDSGSLSLYSAVFSPTKLNTTIVHHWEWYDDQKSKWIEAGKVELPVVGGRDDGYRTYSVKEGLTNGKWRVSVETLSGQVIGRVLFKIVPTTKPFSLVQTTGE